MPRHWFVGLSYFLIAVLNVYRQGVRPLRWVPWALMCAGTSALEYLPVKDGSKDKPKLAASMRNKASVGTLVLGVVWAVLLITLQLIRH
jgi:hypothetical protein